MNSVCHGREEIRRGLNLFKSRDRYLALSDRIKERYPSSAARVFLTGSNRIQKR